MQWGTHPDCCGVWLPYRLSWDIDEIPAQSHVTTFANRNPDKWKRNFDIFLKHDDIPPMAFKEKGLSLAIINQNQEIYMESTLRKHSYHPILRRVYNPNSGNYINLWAQLRHLNTQPKSTIEFLEKL